MNRVVLLIILKTYSDGDSENREGLLKIMVLSGAEESCSVDHMETSKDTKGGVIEHMFWCKRKLLHQLNIRHTERYMIVLGL